MSPQWFETFFQGALVEFWTRIIPHSQTLQEASFVERAFDLPPGAKVLDLACGNGRDALELARRGYRVTGVDLSREFLDLARSSAGAENLDIRWIHADMRELARLKLSGLDAVLIFGNSFGYLDRPGSQRLLQDLAAALKPGGGLAIDTGVAAESILPALRPQRWNRAGDIFLLSEPRYSPEASRLDIEYTVVQSGRVETHLASSYVFTTRELLEMVTGAGFEQPALQGGFEGEPYALGTPRLVLTARRSARPT